MRVRATRARHAVERAEMEDFFMQCVEVSDNPCYLCSYHLTARPKALSVTHRLQFFKSTTYGTFVFL